MKNLDDYVLCIYNNTSRNGVQKFRPSALFCQRSQIVEWAENELRRAGESIEDLAGIPISFNSGGDTFYGRELSGDELFSLSVGKLGDDGRMFETFGVDESGRLAFALRGAEFGLEAEAAGITKHFELACS